MKLKIEEAETLLILKTYYLGAAKNSKWTLRQNILVKFSGKGICKKILDTAKTVSHQIKNETNKWNQI